MTIREVMSRGRRTLRRRGLRGTAEVLSRRARRWLALSESHVWYSLDLQAPRPERPLATNLVLRRGEDADLPLLDQLDTIGPREATDRLKAGNDWWLVLDGPRPLFSCSIFRQTAPAIAAPGGGFPLPPGVACLEDSVTAPAARGRGVAPAAWCLIADGLAAEGKAELITKVEVDNVASRRAVEKAGFQGVALMHFRRVGTWSRTSLEVVHSISGGFLAAAIGAGMSYRPAPG